MSPAAHTAAGPNTIPHPPPTPHTHPPHPAPNVVFTNATAVVRGR